MSNFTSKYVGKNIQEIKEGISNLEQERTDIIKPFEKARMALYKVKRSRNANLETLKRNPEIPFKVKNVSIDYQDYQVTIYDITIATEEFNTKHKADYTTFKENDDYLEKEFNKLTEICKEYEKKRLLKNRGITIRKLKLINEETRETFDNYGKMAAEDFLKEKTDDVNSLLKDLQAYSALLGDVEFTIYTLSPKDVYKILFDFIPEILPFEHYENILIEFLSFEEAFEYAGYNHILDLAKKIPEYKRLSDGELENIVIELTKYVDDAISDYRTRVLEDSILNSTGVPESWWDYDHWWNEVDSILAVKNDKFLQVVSVDVQKTVEIRTDPLITVQPQKIYKYIESLLKENLDILSIKQKDIPNLASEFTDKIQSSFLDKQVADLEDATDNENYQDKLLIFDSYFFNRVDKKMLNLLIDKKQHPLSEGDISQLKNFLIDSDNKYLKSKEKIHLLDNNSNKNLDKQKTEYIKLKNKVTNPKGATKPNYEYEANQLYMRFYNYFKKKDNQTKKVTQKLLSELSEFSSSTLNRRIKDIKFITFLLPKLRKGLSDSENRKNGVEYFLSELIELVSREMNSPVEYKNNSRQSDVEYNDDYRYSNDDENDTYKNIDEINPNN